MTPATPTALIAEDEPLLAAGLRAELAQAWPQLQVLASVGDGASAVRQALALLPDVLFFDIRMPGMSGLEAAAELADAWPAQPGAKPFPALVFITAYDQYAVQAFEAQALDYLMKPVQAARLQKTVAKLQAALAARAQDGGAEVSATLERLGRLLAGAGLAAPPAPGADPAAASGAAAPPAGAPASASPALPLLQAVPVAVGNSIRMVPIAEVLYFEAADKYVRVLTAEREYLIRTPLKDLLPQLDAQVFWQIHRGTVVRSSAIDSITRDEAGKLTLLLRGRADKLVVSRLYAHLFKAL